MMAEDFCDFSQNAQKIKTEQNKNQKDQIDAVRAGLVSNTEPHCYHIDYK